MNEENQVAELLVGSRLYGTALPASDTDYLRVYLPPARTLIGTEASLRHGGDESAYYLHEFVKILMGKGAIGLFEALCITDVNNCPQRMWWYGLRGIKDAFISKRLEKSAVGYIRSELARIERRRRWLQGDIFPEEQKSAKRWKPDEAEIQYGWDVKGAMHCVRLLMEMDELEETGTICFPLRHADTLLEIRTGTWSYDDFVRFMEGVRFSWDFPDEPEMFQIENYLAHLYLKVLEAEF